MSLPMLANNGSHMHRHSVPLRKPTLSNNSAHAASQAEAVAALVSLPNTPHDDNDSEFDDHDSMMVDHPGGGGRHGESASDRKKRRRNRQTLSCTECKRRKIKCDRKIPCESCIKREEAHNCHWEDPKKELPAQPFALTSDVDCLKVRIAHIEEVLRGMSQRFDIMSMSNNMPNSYDSNMNSSNRMSNSTTPANHNYISTNANGYRSSSLETSSMNREELDSDTEDAALVLEELATRGPGFECKVEELGKRSKNIGSRQIRFLETSKDYERLGETKTTIANIFKPPEGIHGIRAISFLPPKLDPVLFKGYFAELVLQFVPKRSVADTLIKIHLKNADFTFGPIYRPIFLKEVDAFWDMCDQNRARDVDPSWLSLFMRTCALGVLHANAQEIKFEHDWSENDLKEMPQALYEVAIIAVKQSETLKRPLFRVVQTSVLFISYLQASGHFYTPEWFSWLSIGAKNAQLLGLHVLGSDPTTMPRDDPALPPGVNGVKREIAKRVWWQLVFSDYMQSLVFGHSNYVTPAHITTNEILNLDDEDLSMTDINRTGKPEYVTTSTSFLIFGVRMAKLQKTLLSLQRNKSLNYENLLDLDKQLRDVAHQISTAIDTLEARTNVDPKHAQIKRCVVTSGIHTRLASFHRPYMLRGYKDPRYSTSTSVCVSSAKTVLIAQKQLQSIGHSCFWYASMHILTATLILFIDLFHDIDKGSTESEISEKEDALKTSLELFDSTTKGSSSGRELAEMGRKIVLGLFDALQRRRAGAASARKTRQVNKFVNGVETTIKAEPIGSVLKKLATSVSHAGGSVNSNTSPSQQTHYPSSSSPQSILQHNRSTSQSPIALNTGASGNPIRTPSGTFTTNGGPPNYRSDSTNSSSGHDSSPSTILENFDFGLDDETNQLLKSLGLFKAYPPDKEKSDDITLPIENNNPITAQTVPDFEPFLGGPPPLIPNQIMNNQNFPSTLPLGHIASTLQSPHNNGFVSNNINAVSTAPPTTENLVGNNFSAFMGLSDGHGNHVASQSIWQNEVWN